MARLRQAITWMAKTSVLYWQDASESNDSQCANWKFLRLSANFSALFTGDVQLKHRRHDLALLCKIVCVRARETMANSRYPPHSPFHPPGHGA